MNSAHDLGGMQGFGPVHPERDEPVFHAPWERQALALTLAMGATGAWNLDASRHARESLPPAFYLGSSYYEIWLAGLRRLMLERGLLSAAEWDSGLSHSPGVALPRRLQAEQVDAVLAKGSPVDRPASTPARFTVGAQVKTRHLHPPGHTRLPRYARGRSGVVVRVQGHHLFADANAHRAPDAPEVAAWLYAVRFSARELWGESGHPNDCVHLDIWEPMLEPAFPTASTPTTSTTPESP